MATNAHQSEQVATPAQITSRRRLLGWTAGGGAALAGAALASQVMAPEVAAQDTASIVGSWLVSVPEADGSTSLTGQVFMADGSTLTQFSSAGPDHGASLGYGVWQQTGDRQVEFSFRGPRYDALGISVGQGPVQVRATLNEAANAWSGPAVISFFAPDGALEFRTPPLTVRATRVALEPLA